MCILIAALGQVAQACRGMWYNPPASCTSMYVTQSTYLKSSMPVGGLHVKLGHIANFDFENQAIRFADELWNLLVLHHARALLAERLRRKMANLV